MASLLQNRVKKASADANALVGRMGLEEGFGLKKERQRAQKMGQAALEPLGKALIHSDHWQVRWAAAKALGNIGDPSSVGILIDAMDDENSDVGRVAADSLGRLGNAAIRPMLTALMKHPQSQGLQIGVRHVLRRRKRLDPQDIYVGVLEAIEKGPTREAAAVAAYRVLVAMKP